MNELDKVMAGVVLYNPNLDRFYKVIKAIQSQVVELVLVDNGSKNVNAIRECIKGFDNIHLIRNDENAGIATGLNQICKYGLDKGFEWCLTLDHDTVCSTDMVSQLLRFSEDERVGILCPIVDYEGMINNQKEIKSETVDVYACMTSGSLTRLKAWEEVGGFREGFFIDFVDNEFCMRLNLAGYRITRVNGCVMHHQFGEVTQVKVLNFFPRTVIVHSPWRYYYMTRNNLLFIKQYRKHLHIVKEYAKLASILYHGVLFSNASKDTLRFIRLGFRDAYRNKEGQLIQAQQ